MANASRNQYFPDEVLPPGVLLQETIEAMGISQVELSARMGKPTKVINEIIKGKAALTPQTALQLESVLGIPASFWNNGEQRYREFLARRAAQQELREQKEWLQKFPMRALIKAGWIEKHSDEAMQLGELLAFFGVSSPRAWEKFHAQPQASFRKCQAFESEPQSVAAWLRIGEIEANRIAVNPYDKNAFLATLKTVRSARFDISTLRNEIAPLCAKAGVAVVIVPELPKTRLCGAARWSAGKPIIQLSLRYKRDDRLCFAFFHEAAHILLHPKREIFLECSEMQDDSEREKEADRFAADFLIPPNSFAMLKTRHSFTLGEIQQFAEQIGVAPGVIVGRLQHEKVVAFNQFNELKIVVDATT